jgi:hypothetical protein
MATVAISFLFVFAWFAIFPVQGFPQLSTYSVLLFLFPIFTIQLIGGLFARNLNRFRRFIVMIGLAGLATLGFVLFFGTLNPNIVRNGAMSIGLAFQTAALVVFFAVVAAAAITQFVIVSDEKVKLSGSQYSQNPAVPSKSKRKKK